MFHQKTAVDVQGIFQLWKREERKLQRACDQLDSLNERLYALDTRMAAIRPDGPIAYALRMELSVVEGVWEMFYKYAKKRAHDVAYLWEVMRDACPTMSSDPTSAMLESDVDVDFRDGAH